MTRRSGQRTAHRVLPVVLLLAAVLRLAYFVADRDDPRRTVLVHDAARYHAWAQSLAQGHRFEDGAYEQAPLYPMLVSLLYRVTGPEPSAAYLAQIVLGLATLALVAATARRAHGERAAWAAAALGALYGPAAFHETTLMPTALAVFLAALAVERLQAADASERAPVFAAAGASAGLAALASSGALLFVAAAAVWILGWSPSRRRVSFAAIFLASSVAMFAPVAVRNRLVCGEWVLLATNGGITFAHGNNPDAVGVFTLLPGFSGSVATQRAESRALAEESTGRSLTDGEVSSYWLRWGLASVTERPSRWIVLELRKLALALADREQPLESDPSFDDNPVRRALPISFAVLLGLAAARVAAGTSRSRAETPVHLALGSTLALLLVFYVSSRYRMPAIPALSVLAGAGLMAVVEGGPRGRLRPAAAATVVAALSLAWVPLFGADLERSQQGQGWSERGRSLLGAGRLEEGVEALRRGVVLAPDLAYGWIDLADGLVRGGNASEAEDALREAVRLAPALPEGHYRLGVLLYESGRLAEAADAFEAAYALAPDDPAIANNLLGTLLGLGRMVRADAVAREMAAAGVPVDPPLERWVRSRNGTFR